MKKRIDAFINKHSKAVTVVLYVFFGTSPLWIFLALFCDYVAREQMQPSIEEQLMMWVLGLVYGFFCFLTVSISQERYIRNRDKCDEEASCRPRACRGCKFENCEWSKLAKKGEAYYEEL